MYTDQEVSTCKVQQIQQLQQLQQPAGLSNAIKTLDALPGCQTITRMGAVADLKICQDTVATVDGGGSVAGRSVSGFEAGRSSWRMVVKKRSAVAPTPAAQVVKKRFLAGHGRSIEVDIRDNAS